MKSFLKMFLAAFLALVVGTLIVFLISLVTIGAMIASGETEYVVKEHSVLKIDLSGSLTERSQPSPLAILMGGSSESLTVKDLTTAIKKAKNNKKIEGIYIKSSYMGSNFANLEPVRKALIDFKESGKFIISYGEIYTERSYYLASVADKLALNPKGTMGLMGIGSILEFKKNQYEKLGITHQVFKVGTFKSAVEPYIQTEMSEANRLQTKSYMNSIWSHMLTGISESRNISVDQLNAYVDDALMFEDPAEIVNKGMADTLLYEVDVTEYLKGFMDVEKAKDIKQVSVKNMLKVKEKAEKKGKDKIAVLYAEGAIMDDFIGSSPLMSGELILPKDYIHKMKKLMEDDDVKAVVFRVNSGGGSANASEQIWHSVKELNEVKPVIVSMGGAAASGGYYISCAANSIVAEPTTITGSIGIFGLVANGEELAKKMGLSFEELGTNKFSTFGGSTFGIPFIISARSRGFNEMEASKMQKNVEKGYDLFLTRCAEGRSMTKEQIDSIGQGRVWTGTQALEIGLVDKLGGLQDAIELAAEKASLEKYTVTDYPEVKSWYEQMLSESLGEINVRLAKWYMGEDAYEKKQMIERLRSLTFQQAIMPEHIDF